MEGEEAERRGVQRVRSEKWAGEQHVEEEACKEGWCYNVINIEKFEYNKL